MAAGSAPGTAAASTLAISTATVSTKSSPPCRTPPSAAGGSAASTTNPFAATSAATGGEAGECNALAELEVIPIAAGDRPASRAGADRLGPSSSSTEAEPTGGNAAGGTLTAMAEPASKGCGFAMGGRDAILARSAALCISLRPVSPASDREAGATACMLRNPELSSATSGARSRGIGLLPRAAVSPSALCSASAAGAESAMPGASRATMGLASARRERSAATIVSPGRAENEAGRGSAACGSAATAGRLVTPKAEAAPPSIAARCIATETPASIGDSVAVTAVSITRTAAAAGPPKSGAMGNGPAALAGNKSTKSSRRMNGRLSHKACGLISDLLAMTDCVGVFERPGRRRISVRAGAPGRSAFFGRGRIRIGRRARYAVRRFAARPRALGYGEAVGLRLLRSAGSAQIARFGGATSSVERTGGPRLMNIMIGAAAKELTIRKLAHQAKSLANLRSGRLFSSTAYNALYALSNSGRSSPPCRSSSSTGSGATAMSSMTSRSSASGRTPSRIVERSGLTTFPKSRIRTSRIFSDRRPRTTRTHSKSQASPTDKS